MFTLPIEGVDFRHAEATIPITPPTPADNTAKK